jgi:hypothetical protein
MIAQRVKSTSRDGRVVRRTLWPWQIDAWVAKRRAYGATDIQIQRPDRSWKAL